MTDEYVYDQPDTDDEVFTPIPMHLASVSEGVSLTESASAEHGTTMTWPAPDISTGKPTQILQRQMKRFKAKILVQALTGGVTAVLISNNPDVLKSPAGLPLAAGNYLIITAAPFVLEWENQQPAWAVAIGAGANTVPILVLDQIFA